jgi:hypothetical protein
MLRPYKSRERLGVGERSGTALGRAWLWSASARGAAAFFFGDGFGIDQPLAVTWATRLFLFFAREPAKAEEAADFGAGGVEFEGGLLGGEPAVLSSGHLRSVLPGGLRQRRRDIHSSGS